MLGVIDKPACWVSICIHLASLIEALAQNLRKPLHTWWYMANIICGSRLKDEALKFRASIGISISFQISFMKYVSPVRDLLGLGGTVVSWEMGLYDITGAGNGECSSLKDDPNFIPQKYVIILRSSLEVF